MNRIEHWKATFRRFAADRRGNFVALFAASTAGLLMAVGYGVNLVQLYHVHSSLSFALDAAVTSTARDLTTGQIPEAEAQASVERFFLANVDGAFTAGSARLSPVVVDRTARTVEASAAVDVALAFPVFGMDKTRRVSVETAAIYSDRKIEVAMMLDVTGSMDGSKINDLRSAARNAVETLLDGQNRDRPRIRVALVPYAEAVNVGALARDTVFVEKRRGDDLPPRLDDPIPAAAATRPDTCATERKTAVGGMDVSDDSPHQIRRDPERREYRAMVNRDDRLDTCPNARLVPLTANAADLKRSIEDFRANGVTAGHIGIQWSYYMLSSRWRSSIRNAGLGDGPADSDPRAVAKVAILMTDGLFNTAFAGVSGSSVRLTRNAESSAYASALCRAMRKDGIEIFTIGFDLGRGNNPAKELLRDCATTDTGAIRHFYEAADGAELDGAFQEIARNLERLALTR